MLISLVGMLMAEISIARLCLKLVEQVQQASLYETGITAKYGDQLLTLSTCSYHVSDGRFVVVAKRVT